MVKLISPHKEAIRVKGLVQGVGFRPTVWRYAKALGIKGEVINDGEGVLITLCADQPKIDQFISQLNHNPPPLAKIVKIERQAIEDDKSYQDFKITQSQKGAAKTQVGSDAAICDQCIADISDPDNRRYRYPFTNCTHCGPRLSIIKDIPYDRQSTSMASFKLCAQCLKEYQDPADRRFHAQPNACADCGPKIWICDRLGQGVDTENWLAKTVELLKQGNILALKGIGGFQLICDATNELSLNRLRQRKNRKAKAFALMAKDLAAIEDYCHVSRQEAKTLGSLQAPIVLLNKKREAKQLPDAIAPKQKRLGFMLPYSPLHWLILNQLDFPLVVTSGNLSNEPPCTNNKTALEQLAGLVDYFILNDREIVNRLDDSVVRVTEQQAIMIRRARGYAPNPIELPQGFSKADGILACGAELKNTFCLIKEGKAILSPHIGNLESNASYEDYIHSIHLYQRLFQFQPKQLVVDMHPEYLSSKWGRATADETAIPLLEVQHHKAHIAACLAENHWALDQGDVIGIALDGLGYGDDGSIWGGEFFVGDYTAFERVGRIQPTPMPGGVQAILEPWRNGVAHIFAHLQQARSDQTAFDQALLEQLLPKNIRSKPYQAMLSMIQQSINSPMTSSCGRLFDAVAAMLDISADRISYEGQAAIELENQVTESDIQNAVPYRFNITTDRLNIGRESNIEFQTKSILQIQLKDFWLALLEDLKQQQTKGQIAANFHLGFSLALVKMAEKIKSQTGIATVALSGGVFQNQLLLEKTTSGLQEKGFQVLSHKKIPANDGGISFGQAVIAAAQTISEK